MISYIKGTLEEIRPDSIVVENNGIGYEINTASSILEELPELGQEVKIFTLLVHKEDSMSLYGFLSKDDLALFNLLLTVSGIGPKGGLSILSVMNADSLRFAIIGGDSAAIAKAPGVGKKTAERVIIDLKDKVDLISTFESKLTKSTASSISSSAKQEALMALTSLGYSPSVAAKVLDSMTISESMTTEDILSTALRQMSFI